MSLFCNAVVSIFSSFAISILLRKRELVCFTFSCIIFLIYCDSYCSVAFLFDALGLSAVCNCVISWSFSIVLVVCMDL